jgi:GGDEF domain-containing protein
MMTISVGVALTSDYPERDLGEIIHAADIALYGRRRQGATVSALRNRCRSMAARKSFSQKVRC